MCNKCSNLNSNKYSLLTPQIFKAALFNKVIIKTSLSQREASTIAVTETSWNNSGEILGTCGYVTLMRNLVRWFILVPEATSLVMERNINSSLGIWIQGAYNSFEYHRIQCRILIISDHHQQHLNNPKRFMYSL